MNTYITIYYTYYVYDIPAYNRNPIGRVVHFHSPHFAC